MRRDIAALLLSLTFAIILFSTAIINFIKPDTNFSSMENRILQEKPTFSFDSYFDGRYEKSMEKYVADQFFIRNALINIKATCDKLGGKLESNGVYIGKDHYLFEKNYKPNDLYFETTLKTLKDFKKQYKNINMYFLLAPNSANINNEKLPMVNNIIDQNPYMDRTFKFLDESRFKTIDVRETFIENKDKDLYYRTDHHWTSEGAYIAFKKTSKTLGLKSNIIKFNPLLVKTNFRGTLSSKSGFNNGLNDNIYVYLPEKKQYLPSIIHYLDTNTKSTFFYQLDNLKIKDAYSIFGGTNHPIYTITTPTASNKNLLIIKDSYANSFIPFLTQFYRKITVVDPRYYYEDIDTLIKSKGINNILFLYNTNTFLEDDGLSTMLNN